MNSSRKLLAAPPVSRTDQKGYSEKAIMIECLTYATAGMVTTREFIVMVAWHIESQW